MTEYIFSVSGMHCTGCSSRLEKWLNEYSGVAKASVNFETSTAIISFDSCDVLVDILAQEAEEIGFTLKPNQKS